MRDEALSILDAMLGLHAGEALTLSKLFRLCAAEAEGNEQKLKKAEAEKEAAARAEAAAAAKAAKDAEKARQQAEKQAAEAERREAAAKAKAEREAAEAARKESEKATMMSVKSWKKETRSSSMPLICRGPQSATISSRGREGVGAGCGAP